MPFRRFGLRFHWLEVRMEIGLRRRKRVMSDIFGLQSVTVDLASSRFNGRISTPRKGRARHSFAIT